MALELTREHFLRAAEAARGRDLDTLYAEAGIAAGPALRRLSLAGVELPLRLFVALAARQAYGPGFATRAITQADSLTAVAEAGLAAGSAHPDGWPIRTG